MTLTLTTQSAIKKLSQEAQVLHLSREDLQLKKQLLQKFEESDKRLQENLNSANRIMSNIGVAIQQSVGILGQLPAPRNQFRQMRCNRCIRQ